MNNIKITEKRISMSNDEFDFFVNLTNNSKIDSKTLESRNKHLAAAKKAFSKKSTQKFNFVRA